MIGLVFDKDKCPFFDENKELCDDGDCECCEHYCEPIPPKFTKGDMIVDINHSELSWLVAGVLGNQYILRRPNEFSSTWADCEHIDKNFEKEK